MVERSDLGRRIASLCSLRGTTMAELAGSIGIARNTLSRIVTGDTKDPASSIIVAIAEELETTTDYLLRGIEDKESHFEAAELALV